jgi:hypothetical protein
MNQYRLTLWGAVEIKRREGLIDDQLAKRLKVICDKINLAFFYPIVSRVDISNLSSSRLQEDGSALSGSSEYLIEDLDDEEIDSLLFLDFDSDVDFNKVVTNEYHGYKRERHFTISPDEALTILESRCDASGIQLPLSDA